MHDVDVSPARAAPGRNPVIGSWTEINDYAPVLKWLLVNIVLAIGLFDQELVEQVAAATAV